MGRHAIFQARRAAIGLAIFTGLVVAGPLTARNADAAVAGCRSDPVVILSNLASIDLSASIDDNQSDVKSVTYVIHAPVGLKEVAVVNTDGLIGLVEHVQFIADNTARSYNLGTTVTTGRARVRVTEYATELSVFGGIVGSGSTSGLSGQLLHIQYRSRL